MARHILIACVCETRHTVEPGAMPSVEAARNAFKHIPDVDGRRIDPWRPGEPLAAEPQTVTCGCGYSYRVTWHALDSSAAKPVRRRSGVVFEVIGQRCIVEAFKDGSPVGAWGWMNDRDQVGYMTIARSDKDRRELEALLNTTIFGERAHDPRNKIDEGPARDKRTGKELEQPSREAHEARRIRDEIARIDEIGGKTVTVYAYAK